jgi:lipoate---protein ligase
VVVRRIERPALVMGSTQDVGDFDEERVSRAGVTVVRRRSGGGAVLVGPTDPLWVDVWLPRDDPLWVDDVVSAARWVGEWWVAALASAGSVDLSVHHGGSVGNPLARQICFAGVGPGEVVAAGRKVVGVAQWRAREGALFHTCAYRHVDSRPVTDLLALDDDARRSAAHQLDRSAAGLDDLGMTLPPVEELVATLPPGQPWLTA